MKIEIVMGVIIVLTMIVFLSFIGPEKSHHPFWQIIQMIRNALDFLSYWTMNIIAIGSILLVIFAIFKNL